ncbi:MAG: hypothetical protein ACLQU2_00370 [Candidatus Binataceae bacterium]
MDLFEAIYSARAIRHNSDARFETADVKRLSNALSNRQRGDVKTLTQRLDPISTDPLPNLRVILTSLFLQLDIWWNLIAKSKAT